MRAVEALRAELEEEEQALGGTEAGNASEDAQSEEDSSQAESDGAQQAAAAAAGDADSDGGHASLPDTTCMLISQPMHTIRIVLHRQKDTSALYFSTVLAKQCAGQY